MAQTANEIHRLHHAAFILLICMTQPTKPRLLDWLGSIPFLLAFGFFLAVYDPILRVSNLLYGKPAVEKNAIRLQIWLTRILKLCNTSITVERSDKLRDDEHYVIFANHQSMFDIPIIGCYLAANNPKYVAKAELGKWIPAISYHLNYGGNLLIARDNPKQALKAIKVYGKEAQEQGSSPSIFPEGTRSRDGRLKDFHPAGAITLIKAASNLAVVPITIENSWQLMRFNSFPVPWGTQLKLRLGDPISRETAPREIFALAHAEIDQTLKRWRGEDNS